MLGPTKTYPGQGLGVQPDARQPILEPVLNYRVELTDGTRLSAMLTREIMRSANNSADGESEGPAMPVILTKD